MVTVREAMVGAHGQHWREGRYIESVNGGEALVVPNVTKYQWFEPSPIDEANARVLSSEWADEEAVVWVLLSYGRGLGLRLDAPAPEGMVEVINCLNAFGILSNDAVAEVEAEWAEWYVDEYLHEDLAEYDSDLLRATCSQVRSAWSVYRELDLPYEMAGDRILFDAPKLAAILQGLIDA